MKAAANIRNRLTATASGDFPTRAAELLAGIGYSLYKVEFRRHSDDRANNRIR